MTRALSLHSKVLFVAVSILVVLFSLYYYYSSIDTNREINEARIDTTDRYIHHLVEITLQHHMAVGDLQSFQTELKRILAGEDVASLKIRTGSQTVYLVSRPAEYSPEFCDERTHELLGPDRRSLGTVTIGYWKNREFMRSPKIQLLNGIIVADLIVLAALVFHLLVKEIVTRPLWRFVEATRTVAQGQFDRKLALEGGSQEEQLLAESFNEMIQKVAHSQEELRDANLFLEQRVRERTHQLQQAHSFSEAVIATAQEGIYAVDSQKRITTFNEGAERITGLKAADVLGRDCRSVMNYPFCEKACILERLRRGTRPDEGQEELLDEMQKKGRSWLITGGLFKSAAGGEEADFPGGVETIKDLTNTMRLQHQLRQFDKLSSLGTLSAGVAHELNNPLSNIKIFAQLLAESSETDRSSIQNIVAQADRASAIVKKMLEFSGGQHVSFEPLSIAEVIRQSVDMVRFTVEKAGITIRIEIEDDLPQVVGSRLSLQQVLINLFTNAQQAMTGVGGTLDIGARFDRELDRILIRVADTGTGIPPELINRIFDPFFTTKDIGVGTGLGLSISYGIIKDHGGEVRVESTPGQGACFEISLPARIESSPEGALETTHDHAVA